MKTEINSVCPGRELLSLESLIEARTVKIDILVADEPNKQATCDAEGFSHVQARIIEYSSVVHYLNELKALKEGAKC
ncbi:MAG: hypothetical protein PHY48_14370 [Candidatus Cloacimonetes bacterium]|nr:hypothetical protein [Candidatus Cloacimonadota bacterium]